MRLLIYLWWKLYFFIAYSHRLWSISSLSRSNPSVAYKRLISEVISSSFFIYSRESTNILSFLPPHKFLKQLHLQTCRHLDFINEQQFYWRSSELNVFLMVLFFLMPSTSLLSSSSCSYFFVL